jgi:diaminopimelate decarboxylase
MKFLTRAGGELRLEGVPLAAIASRFGTPCYVYSRAAIEDAFRQFDEGLAGVEHLVCYAVKANSNLAVLDLLARLGAGFDIVSGGELARVLAAGGRADRVLFSGVGKSTAEIEAALAADIKCFNVESEPELERLAAAAARAGKVAPVSLRINPDVDARTHPYISTGLAGNKFGIPHGRALEVYRHAARLASLRVVGIDCHIGSQILDTAPLDEALERVLDLVDALAKEGIALEHVDLGGGFGIRYRDEAPLDYRAYCRHLAERIAGRGIALLLEPGRAVVGNAGRAPHARRVPQARQGEALRRGGRLDERAHPPALYGSWHDIVPVAGHGARSARTTSSGPFASRAMCWARIARSP